MSSSIHVVAVTNIEISGKAQDFSADLTLVVTFAATIPLNNEPRDATRVGARRAGTDVGTLEEGCV